MDDHKGAIVDAIYEGRIVQVSERVALLEGLPILRRKEISFLGDPTKQAVMKEANRKERTKTDRMDTFRRPLKSLKNNVLASLIDNFHWQIAAKRKEFNLTRRQLGERLGISEGEVKMIENGVLPKDDYVVISKLEQLFGISLKKEGVKAPDSAFLTASKLEKKESSFVEKSRERLRVKETSESKPAEALTGSDVEIDFEE